MRGGAGSDDQYDVDGECDGGRELNIHAFGLTGTANFTGGIGNGTIASSHLSLPR